MLTIRKSSDRGLADHGWLKSLHTFSFADYYDPEHMGFRALRVINEDRIAGGTGFGMHGHRDMEIISYVIKGALEHRDSKGNTAIIRPGEVQRMSAGTGVMHSEYNKSSTDETHFLQIWILPDRAGTSFGYGQKSFEQDLLEKDLVLVVSRDGRDGSIAINQDADIYASRLPQNKSLEFPIRSQRNLWVQIIKGELNINGTTLKAGDAVAVTQEERLQINTSQDSEFLIFDLA